MNFVEPWALVEKYADEPVAELARELPDGHVLFGRPMKAVARRKDCDDVLFQLCDASEQFAVVHLTWSGKQDLHSKFPWTELFTSFAEFEKTECNLTL